jgi:ubiquinone biosynthesis protein
MAGREFARRLRVTFGRLGGVYVKFGQLLGSAPSIFGREVSAEFRDMLDRGDPVRFSEVVATLEREWHRPLYEVVQRIDPRPVGCASLAVVHRARLRSGEEVAVKVLRPSIEAHVSVDMGLLQPLAAVVARRFGVGEAEPAVRLLDGLSRQLSEELDLRREALMLESARVALDVLSIHVGSAGGGSANELSLRGIVWLSKTHETLRRLTCTVTLR